MGSRLPRHPQSTHLVSIRCHGLRAKVDIDVLLNIPNSLPIYNSLGVSTLYAFTNETYLVVRASNLLVPHAQTKTSLNQVTCVSAQPRES